MVKIDSTAPSSFRLENGLPVVYRYVPGLESVGVSFAVNGGSVYETQKTNGCSHFLEHMLFKGTKKRDGLWIKTNLDDMCGLGNWNGVTDREKIVYIFKTHKSLFGRLMDVVSDIVKNSKISRDSMDIERGAILNENLMRMDNPIVTAIDTMFDNLFKGHSAALHTIGDTASIEKISRDAVNDMYRRYYTPDNCVLSVYGAIKPDEVTRLSKKLFQDLSGKFGGRKVRPISTKIQNKEITVRKRSLNQVLVLIGLRIPVFTPGMEKDFLALNVLEEVLRRSLWNKIREQNGLAYDAGSTFLYGKTYGGGVLYCGTQPKNIEIVTKMMLNELKSTVAGKINRTVVENTVAATVRDLKTKYAENTLSSSLSAAGLYLMTGDPVRYFKRPSMYETVGINDVKRVASEYIDTSKLIKVTLEPETQKI